MAKPPRITPIISFPKDLLAEAAQEASDAQTAALVPSSVTGAWDSYRKTLGVTVPANVNRARKISGSFMGLVR